METLETLLREVALFDGMADDQIALVAGCGSNVHFAEDEVLFREGEAADTFYLVRHGTVALELFVPARAGMTIDTLGPGEVIGWSWLYPPYRWHFDARAASPVRATAFDGACIRGKSEKDPALGYALMSRFGQMMMERLQATRVRLLDVYGHAGAR